MNLGMPEMIFIFLLALVIFGPKKLPELGRQLGKALAEFKKASNEFKNQLEAEMMNIELEERAKKQQRSRQRSQDPSGGKALRHRQRAAQSSRFRREPFASAPEPRAPAEVTDAACRQL